MSVAAVANQPSLWDKVGPYVVPAAQVAGVAFIVCQVWGRVAAGAFLGIAIASAIAFPSIRDQLTANDLVRTIARAVVLVALPFFGIKGVIVAIGIAAISGVFQELRMFEIRARLAQAEAVVEESNRKLAELALKRQEMIDAVDKKCQEAEAKLSALVRDEGAALKTVEALQEKLIGYKTLLTKLLDGFTLQEADLEFANNLLKTVEGVV